MVYLVTSGSIDPSSVTTVVFLSMAGGFAAIWPLGLAALPRTTHPWPLVPATVLGLIGLAFAARQPMALDWIQAGVALFLVVAGPPWSCAATPDNRPNTTTHNETPGHPTGGFVIRGLGGAADARRLRDLDEPTGADVVDIAVDRDAGRDEWMVRGCA